MVILQANIVINHYNYVTELILFSLASLCFEFNNDRLVEAMPVSTEALLLD